MNTRHDKGEFDRLRDELRRLKRKGAPWYFESELHRRLHGGHAGGARLRAFPLTTAYVLTFVVLASLSVAGYLMMLQSGLFAPSPGAEGEIVPAASADTLAQVAPLHIPERVVPPPRRETVGERIAVPPGDVAGRQAQDRMPPETSAQFDSMLQSGPVTADRDRDAQDTLQGRVALHAESGHSDSAKSELVVPKDTTNAGRDSIPARKDTANPAPRMVPGK